MRDAAAFKRRTVHRLKLHLVPFGPLVHIARPSGVPARYTEGGNARFPDRMQAWLQFIGLIVTIVGAAVWIVRTLGRLESRIERIELRIGTVEYQNRALLKAFPQLISSLMAGGQVTPQQGSNLIATALDTPSITELLSQIKPTPNPLPLEDLNRLRNYVQRLKQGEWFTRQEAQDFHRLADTVSREYPSNEGSWLLFLVGGLVLGFILADSKK